jgi:hypothetical protein
MQIHDQKDQLIYVLTSIAATMWVGLVSVGFWYPFYRELFWLFWIMIGLQTICTGLLFLSSIAAYKYGFYHENSTLDGIDKESRKFYLKQAERWRFWWNIVDPENWTGS